MTELAKNLTVGNVVGAASVARDGMVEFEPLCHPALLATPAGPLDGGALYGKAELLAAPSISYRVALGAKAQPVARERAVRLPSATVLASEGIAAEGAGMQASCTDSVAGVGTEADLLPYGVAVLGVLTEGLAAGGTHLRRKIPRHGAPTGAMNHSPVLWPELDAATQAGLRPFELRPYQSEVHPSMYGYNAVNWR